MICYCLGMRGAFSVFILALYGMASVIRLAFFNVMEEKRQQKTTEVRKYYQGLPVTSIAIIFPVIYLLRPYLGQIAYLRVLIAVMLLVALLNISNVKVKKPGNKEITVFVLLAVVIIGKLLKLY